MVLSIKGDCCFTGTLKPVGTSAIGKAQQRAPVIPLARRNFFRNLCFRQFGLIPGPALKLLAAFL
jgi:hypothetical protein